jgi:hypothetical protein
MVAAAAAVYKMNATLHTFAAGTTGLTTRCRGLSLLIPNTWYTAADFSTGEKPFAA